MRTTFVIILLFTFGKIFSQNAELAYGSGNNSFLDLYQKYISPAKGGNTCPMYPSCSQYSKLAFEKQGMLLAYLNTCERLMRCGNDLEKYSSIEFNDHKYSLDTVGLEIGIEKDSSLASKMFENYDYLPSLVTYEKLYYSDSMALYKDYYRYKIALCYYWLKDFDKFKALYQIALSSHLSQENKDSLTYLQALYFYNTKSYANSKLLLNSINTKKQDFKEEILFLSGRNSLQQQNWKESVNYMKQIPSNSELFGKSVAFNELETESENLKFKSPALGLLTSIILPGSGYWYANKKGTAVAAFLINGLFIWAATDAWRNKQYGIFSVTCMLGSGWYTGNILGGYKAVNQYNIGLKDNLVKKYLNY